VPPAPRPQVVLPQSCLPSPYLHRTPAHGGRSLGPAHPAAGPTLGRPRRGPGGHSWGAAWPPVGRGGEPEHSPAPAPEAAAARFAHAPGARGGRFRPAETAHLWHHPRGSGAPPACGAAPGSDGRDRGAVAPAAAGGRGAGTRSFTSLCRRRPARGARGHPGRGPFPPAAESPGNTRPGVYDL
jgi:hypothetical protein